MSLVLELPLPDAEARESIFRIELRRKPLAPDIDVKDLAALTEGASGADIAFVCRKATTEALKAHLKGEGEREEGSLRLERVHFDAALGELQKRKR